MWRPDRSVHGPERATARDVEPLNRLFAEAFTDRYRRDGLVGRAGAVSQAGDLALRDRGCGRGRHDVARRRRPARGVQHGAPLRHRGLDGAARRAARPAGRRRGARHRAGGHRAPALARRHDHRPRDDAAHHREHRLLQPLGFVPRHLTVTLVRDAVRAVARDATRLSSGDIAGGIAECAELTSRVAPGVDFSRELLLTHEMGLGDTTLVRRGGAAGRVRALALHAAGRGPAARRAARAQAGGDATPWRSSG